MSLIARDIIANNEQIRLNRAAISFMLAGHGTQTRDVVSSDLHDDTAASVAQLHDYNAGLREANAILRSAI